MVAAISSLGYVLTITLRQGKMSEKNTITVERLSDGRVVQVMPDGSKRLLQDRNRLGTAP